MDEKNKVEPVLDPAESVAMELRKASERARAELAESNLEKSGNAFSDVVKADAEQQESQRRAQEEARRAEAASKSLAQRAGEFVGKVEEANRIADERLEQTRREAVQAVKDGVGAVRDGVAGATQATKGAAAAAINDFQAGRAAAKGQEAPAKVAFGSARSTAAGAASQDEKIVKAVEAGQVPQPDRKSWLDRAADALSAPENERAARNAAMQQDHPYALNQQQIKDIAVASHSSGKEAKYGRVSREMEDAMQRAAVMGGKAVMNDPRTQGGMSEQQVDKMADELMKTSAFKSNQKSVEVKGGNMVGQVAKAGAKAVALGVTGGVAGGAAAIVLYPVVLVAKLVAKAVDSMTGTDMAKWASIKGVATAGAMVMGGKSAWESTKNIVGGGLNNDRQDALKEALKEGIRNASELRSHGWKTSKENQGPAQEQQQARGEDMVAARSEAPAKSNPLASPELAAKLAIAQLKDSNNLEVAAKVQFLEKILDGRTGSDNFKKLDADTRVEMAAELFKALHDGKDNSISRMIDAIAKGDAKGAQEFAKQVKSETTLNPMEHAQQEARETIRNAQQPAPRRETQVQAEPPVELTFTKYEQQQAAERSARSAGEQEASNDYARAMALATGRAKPGIQNADVSMGATRPANSDPASLAAAAKATDGTGKGTNHELDIDLSKLTPPTLPPQQQGNRGAARG